jgi:hypothetical protein
MVERRDQIIEILIATGGWILALTYRILSLHGFGKSGKT